MMQFNKWKSFIIKNGIFYAAGILAVVGIKYFYRRAGSDDLTWILAPTARWVRILTGIPFEYEPDVGYINYACRFIIAASCSGVQFMVIAIATLTFSFVHRMRTIRDGFCWTGLSMGLSYISTILVNGLRIVISIYLPLYLHRTDSYSGWLTPERLHTIIGISVYFTSLLVLYRAADHLSQMISGMTLDGASDRPYTRIIRACMPPVFWYFFIILGIPFLNKGYQNDIKKYMDYGFLIAVICLAVITVYGLACVMRKHSGRIKEITDTPSHSR